MKLYQRGPDGATVPPSGYEPIPEAKDGLFQHGCGSERPVEIHGWQFSVTFNRWSALVTFADGWHGWTWPNT